MSKRLEQRALSGSVASFVAVMAAIMAGIFQVPVMLTVWSPAEYGIWCTVMAAINVLIALDAGHQSYVGNEMLRLWGKPDLRSVVGSACLAAILIAGTELLVGVLLLSSGTGASLANFELKTEAGKHALFIYLLFWCIVGSVGGVVVRLYVPAGLFARSQWLSVAARIAAFLALVISAVVGLHTLGAMCIFVVTSACYNLYVFRDVKRQIPELWPWWRAWSWRVAVRNLRRSSLITLSGLLDQACTSGIILIAAAVLSPAEIAVVATIRTVANILTQGNGVFLNPITPDLARFHYERQPEKVSAVLSISWLLGGLVTSLMLCLLVVVVEPGYSFWTRGGLQFNAGLLAMSAGAVAIRQWGAPMQVYVATINDLRGQLLVAAARSITTVAVCSVLLARFNVLAVGMGFVAGELVGAIVLSYRLTRLVRDCDGKLPIGSAIIGIVHVVIAGMALESLMISRVAVYIITPFLLALASVVAFMGWRRLPSEVAERIISLVRTRFTWAKSPR